MTPLVLTSNEEANIGRTLASLAWATRIVVLDSGSSDGTEEIARSHPSVRWVVRSFDRHATQWAFGAQELCRDSEYVLALDADMAVTPAFVEELESRFLGGAHDAAMVPFEYRIWGRPLRGSVYPPQARLFRPGRVRIEQPGHTQVFLVDGELYRFRAPVVHDDRKPLDRWAGAQVRYAALELARIREGREPRLQDRLRRWGLMAPVAGALAYVRAGGPLGGAAAARYAYERAAFECLLGIRIMNELLEAGGEPGAERRTGPAGLTERRS